MKNKKKFTIVAVLAALVVGVFGGQVYMNNKAPLSEESSILTPESEDMGGYIFNDSLVPLGPEASGPAEEQHPFLQQVVDLVNEERAKVGAGPLVMDVQLNKAAQIRAVEIYTLFSHDRPNGSRYRTVLDENGISYSGCGENVAYGFKTPKEVMNAWMNSEGHKKNILNPSYTTIGIGYDKGSNSYHYWSQLFTY